MISKNFALDTPVPFAQQTVPTIRQAPNTGTSRDVLLPLQSLRRWVARLTKPLSLVASVAVTGAFLIHSFGLQQVAAEASRANLWPIVGAVALGAVIQVVRAQRTRYLLGQQRAVSLFHSFAAMVVGHGIGDLVPLAPGGPVLRSVLTQRLTRIPVAFSSGVFMVEGTLDVLAPAVLVPYLLFVVPLPTWARWVLVGVLMQATLLLAMLVVLAIRPRLRPGRRLRSLSASRLMDLARQVTDGLRALSANGPRKSLMVAGLSLLVITLMAGQVALFLRAFALTVSANSLLLILVIMLSSGSIPIKIPAFGTITAAAVLPVAGIHGPNVGGYLVTSQFLLSSETIALALLVLGWWFVRGNRPVRGMNSRTMEPCPELHQPRLQADVIAA
jgi:Lysylphosphatidylglycerol synthase TM region